jgi:hypothetical protein
MSLLVPRTLQVPFPPPKKGGWLVFCMILESTEMVFRSVSPESEATSTTGQPVHIAH